MRVLLLYETVYPDHIGGVETRNWELARALARRGHEVTLCGLSGPLAGEPGVRVLPLGPRPQLYNDAGRRSTRQALRFATAVAGLDVSPFDIVESANMPYIHLLPLAARCALARRPLLISWYEYWGPYWRGYVGAMRAPAYRLVEWLTAQLGAAVTASSRLTQERLCARRRRRGAVELLACGIDVGRVARAAAAAGAGREGPPLIYAGRLLTHKRLDLLLHALSLLPACPGPLLTIFGDGPDRPRLEALTAELGLAGRVVFRGHVATAEEVWGELGRARLAVQPSAREGFGLFPLEAMAAGLPVVHCDSSESAVDELVRDDVEGLTAPSEPAALADAIAALLADDPRRARLAAAARARAAGYDYSAVAARFEAICERLLPSFRG